MKGRQKKGAATTSHLAFDFLPLVVIIRFAYPQIVVRNRKYLYFFACVQLGGADILLASQWWLHGGAT